ncbi:MAG: hypothetical protein LBP63_10030 [Prevotellaceae bacterium]|jgi:hypothetical protein|nr:hypothetical protein [Prevotellaceae bacterium]
MKIKKLKVKKFEKLLLEKTAKIVGRDVSISDFEVEEWDNGLEYASLPDLFTGRIIAVLYDRNEMDKEEGAADISFKYVEYFDIDDDAK